MLKYMWIASLILLVWIVVLKMEISLSKYEKEIEIICKCKFQYNSIFKNHKLNDILNPFLG